MSDCYAISDLMEMIGRYIVECENRSTNEGQPVPIEPTLVGFYQWCKDHRYV